MAKKTGQKGFRNQWLLIGLIIAVGIALFLIVTTLFLKLFQTETYYVLNQDVPTRTQVTPEMLSPVTTSEGTAPQAAIGIADVQSGEIFTNYPLLAGDILTASNVGNQEDISVGIPDSWVITNFSVNADNAVGGRITRGTYFDMMVLDENNQAFYPFVNILALDTTVDLSNASSAAAADSEEAHAGQTTQYVVGMSPQDAAKLQSIVQQHGSDKIKLVLSPRANEYQKPALSDYSGLFSYNTSDTPKNMGENTDRTFTPVKRNELGAPENESTATCSAGNNKLSEEQCKAAGLPTTSTNNSTENTVETTTENG